MKRIFFETLNGSTKWFNEDVADSYKEDTFWDGNNRISVATGSQFYHERLYKTKTGVFVLYKWSNYQGSVDTYEEINKEDAIIWMAKNNHEVNDPILDEYEV